jgi:two-component sensor histidine kinase
MRQMMTRRITAARCTKPRPPLPSLPLDMVAESNHRIANSLQLVAAMLSIESRQLDDGEARHSLEMTGLRIQAIAGVHRRLYAAPSVDALDVADYLVALIAELRPVCLPCLNDGELITELHPLLARPEMAISLGLIVTEATLNACKYAYAGGESGDVTIRLMPESAKSSRLEIADHGCGMAPHQGPIKQGYGARVIALAASRIGGHFAYEDNRPGTRFVLSFPHAETT